jgi:hypothetical protein
MNDSMPQSRTLAELQDLLLDLVEWSQGHSQYGLYCKLCGGEGVDVEHDDNCPVPDVRPTVNAVRPDMALLRTLVAAFAAWGQANGPEGSSCKLCMAPAPWHQPACPLRKAPQFSA